MLNKLVNLDDLTAERISEAKDDGRITEAEAKTLLAYRAGRLSEIDVADAWALRIRLTKRTRQRNAWALGRHYADMSARLRQAVGLDGKVGFVFKTEDGAKFTGTVLAVGPDTEGWFAINPETGDGGRGRTFHFDEIPVDCFGVYNR